MAKYSADQIVVILRDVDRLCKMGKTIEEAVKCAGITKQTYYRWRAKYGWMTVDDYQKMRELETENTRLKGLVRLWLAAFGEEGPTPQGGSSHIRPIP